MKPGACEADAIKLTLQEMEVSRPLTLDLLKNVIGEMGGEGEYIVITDLRNDVFFARIVMAAGFDGFLERVNESLNGSAHAPGLVITESFGREPV